MPEKTATATPLRKSNSATAAAFCSGLSAASLRAPAMATTMMPAMRDEQAEQDDVAAGRIEQLGGEIALEDRRDQRAEHGAQPQHHRHAERQAEIAHGEAVGEAAEPPEHAEDDRPDDHRGRRRAEHAEQVVGLDRGEEPRRQQPGEDAAGQPVDLPGPALHAAMRARRSWPRRARPGQWKRTPSSGLRSCVSPGGLVGRAKKGEGERVVCARIRRRRGRGQWGMWARVAGALPLLPEGKGWERRGRAAALNSSAQADKSGWHCGRTAPAARPR